ncbi:MAG: hypothetical protein AAGA86_10810 [Bacteroidota bacterium]
MKNEIIVPFPGYGNSGDRTVGTAEKTEVPIRPRTVLRLGKPSRLNYEYVYVSLHFNKHTLSDFKELLKFQGMEVQVVSILTMKDGSSIATLRRLDGQAFSDTLDVLFADVAKSIKARELLR